MTDSSPVWPPWCVRSAIQEWVVISVSCNQRQCRQCPWELMPELEQRFISYFGVRPHGHWHISRYMVSMLPCHVSDHGPWILIMWTMNTDMWTMNTDHVDHEHWHMGHEHWYVSVHGDSCRIRYIYALVQHEPPMNTDMSVFMASHTRCIHQV